MSEIRPAALFVMAFACLLLALGCWMLARARHKAHEQRVQRHLQRSLLIRQTTVNNSLPAPASAEQPATIARRRPRSAWHTWLNRQSQPLGAKSKEMALLLGLGGLLITTLATLFADLPMGLLCLTLYLLLCACGIWRRIQQRRSQLLRQLPGFLDNTVRLIVVGNTPVAAFQMASGHIPPPLGDALQHANAALRASPDLGLAMQQLERSWQLPEFGLLAAVFHTSTRYGGRADQVLERVASYIRDRLSAERELHALSAEIRISAWVLALLPILVGGLIMVLNTGYFMRMWNDADGQQMVLLAVGLEALGAFILYRLASLK